MKQNLNKLFVFLILIVELVLLTYFGSMKKGMHFDECFSYFNTNNSIGRQAYDRTFVNSEEIMKDFYVLKGEEFNYSYVVTLQSYDVHPPLFYLFLHTICSFMPGVFSLWQGISLNIVISLITLLFIYLILKNIVKDEYAIYGIMFLGAINTGTICNAMYIRMYCLMTMWIVMAVYLHVLMFYELEKGRKLSLKYIVLNGCLAFLGFMTHYFYLVFLFFLEASFWIPRLGKIKVIFKNIISYGSCLLLFGLLGVILYPSSLGHVNSGYRGQEVKSYLFDLSDLGGRLNFFGGLINRFVFLGFLYVFLLVVILLSLFLYYRNKTKGSYDLSKYKILLECIIVPSFGYFLVAAKGSLVGDETMMRYEMPIFMLSLVGVLVLLYFLILDLFSKNRINRVVLLSTYIVFLILSIYGLLNKNVFYLYEEQERMDAIAQEYSNKACVYIYNNESNKYLLWNDFMQLSKYEDVYFINSENDALIDEKKINNADDLVVYISTLNEFDDFTKYKELIKNSNPKLDCCEKLYDAMYATCYYFY